MNWGRRLLSQLLAGWRGFDHSRDSAATDDWDEAIERWPGLTVLIGYTRLHANGELDRQEQWFGQIGRVIEGEGIEVRLAGQRAGDVEWLPPDLRSFRTAPPGEFRLRSTGEIVREPDLLSNWTVQAGSPG